MSETKDWRYSCIPCHKCDSKPSVFEVVFRPAVVTCLYPKDQPSKWQRRKGERYAHLVHPKPLKKSVKFEKEDRATMVFVCEDCAKKYFSGNIPQLPDKVSS